MTGSESRGVEPRRLGLSFYVAWILGALAGVAIISSIMTHLHSPAEVLPQKLPVAAPTYSELLEARLNENLPIMIDPVTRLDRIHYAEKVLTYEYYVTDRLPDAEDVDHSKSKILTKSCDLWLQHFKSGFIDRLRFTYLYKGKKAGFVIEQKDCDGIASSS